MKTLEEMTMFDIDKRLYNSAYNISDAIGYKLGNTKLGIELLGIVIKEFLKATVRLQEDQHKEDFDQVKTNKRLWKCKCIRSFLTSPCKEEYTDVRELTIDEAINWHNDLKKQINDSNYTTFSVYDGGLFYKKDGEWVLYEMNEKEKENN